MKNIHRVIEHCFDVVQADIPMLLGCDFFDSNQFYTDNIENILVKKQLKYSMPLVRKFGHMYLECDSAEVLYTRSELKKLHLHFKHLGTDKLLNLLKRSQVKDVDASTRRMLEEIVESCETCMRFSRPPQHFRVTTPPDKIIFNEEVTLELMWLEGKAILHFADCHTRFNSASQLKGRNVGYLWEAFIKCWSGLYTGYPRKVLVDQGSAFTSIRWKRLCDIVGTELQLSGAESHHSLGSGERYHASLRQVYLEVRHEHTSVDKETTLKIAVKALNNTMGPEVLVISYRVFGVLPKFPAVNSQLPDQVERMEA